MKFSFIVVTDGTCMDKVGKIRQSIIDDVKTKFEFICVTDEGAFYHDGYVWRDKRRDFSGKPGHITAKKNFGIQISTNPYLCIMHDYFRLESGWYEGFVRFNEENPDWEIAMNGILCMDGRRYRDWICFFGSKIGPRWIQKEPWQNESRLYWGSPHLLPYAQPGADFISGGYWVCRKHVMEQEPLNESLVWGRAEDVEWSDRVIPKYKYLLNPYSKVSLLKEKDPIFPELK